MIVCRRLIGYSRRVTVSSSPITLFRLHASLMTRSNSTLVPRDDDEEITSEEDEVGAELFAPIPDLKDMLQKRQKPPGSSAAKKQGSWEDLDRTRVYSFAELRKLSVELENAEIDTELFEAMNAKYYLSAKAILNYLETDDHLLRPERVQVMRQIVLNNRGVFDLGGILARNPNPGPKDFDFKFMAANGEEIMLCKVDEHGEPVTVEEPEDEVMVEAEDDDPEVREMKTIWDLIGKKDFRAVRSLAQKGSIFAMKELAELYETGEQGFRHSPQLAQQWTLKAALAGDAESLFNHAELLRDGCPRTAVRGDLSKARVFMLKAADSKNSTSEYWREAAKMCLFGMGGPEDYVEARRLFKKAAEEGDREACAHYADMLGERLGEPPDADEHDLKKFKADAKLYRLISNRPMKELPDEGDEYKMAMTDPDSIFTTEEEWNRRHDPESPSNIEYPTREVPSTPSKPQVSKRSKVRVA